MPLKDMRKNRVNWAPLLAKGAEGLRFWFDEIEAQPATW